MEIKPGYQTSEFWVTLVGQIVALLVLFGVLSPEDADTVGAAAVQVVLGLFALAASALPIIQFIRSRTQVKEASLYAEAAAHEAAVYSRSLE